MAHINAQDNTQPSETLEEVPYLHFLNLVEANPDTSIEVHMFRHDVSPVETNNGDYLTDILDKEGDHDRIFIHNKKLLQKGSIKPI